ncbi:hypothetical protein CASFOL_039398 [Castilleja foliolosa]|uniref:HSF-type DNA-binding domain-containing protein n=1 Tax=Castilleja foliolosa TaxID=1961234 RepID=A0ABD3BIG7_9LAMI
MDCETTAMSKNTEIEKTGMVDEDDDDVLCIPNPGRKLEPRPPPFLTKTYDMVDDPKTNSYITWNSSGTGFVISDHNNFSAHVLPTFFKTTNFSSFVYQLNSYGFRKISWERYEYGNQWFQAGKKHWLKNIKRRGQVQQPERSQTGKKRTRARASFTPDQGSTNVTVESKLDAMITEQNEMKRNIQTLKQNLDDMEGQLTSLEIPKLPELEDEKTSIAFFLKQFTEYLKKKKTDDNSRRQRLDGSQNTEHQVEPMVNIQGSEVENTAEITENGRFWMGILEGDDAGFESNEGHVYLDDLDSKAMIDEMMAANMQNEIIIDPKPSDRDEDDDHHLQLWT